MVTLEAQTTLQYHPFSFETKQNQGPYSCCTGRRDFVENLEEKDLFTRANGNFFTSLQMCVNSKKKKKKITGSKHSQICTETQLDNDKVQQRTRYQFQFHCPLIRSARQ